MTNVQDPHQTLARREGAHDKLLESSPNPTSMPGGTCDKPLLVGSIGEKHATNLWDPRQTLARRKTCDKPSGDLTNPYEHAEWV